MKEKIDNLVWEKRFVLDGKKTIAGIDEVGRGPLAGPVVVACVVMPLTQDKIIDGVTDSKKLSASKREELYAKILDTATEVTVSMADNDEIDALNILNATKKCMTDCIASLKTCCDVVFVDAVRLNNTKYPTFSIVKGDYLSYSIGAASIVAKVVRDRLMTDMDKKYPYYGFAQNKGYGTAKHVQALKKFGPCGIHRKTFIKNFFQEQIDLFEGTK